MEDLEIITSDEPENISFPKTESTKSPARSEKDTSIVTPNSVIQTETEATGNTNAADTNDELSTSLEKLEMEVVPVVGTSSSPPPGPPTLKLETSPPSGSPPVAPGTSKSASHAAKTAAKDALLNLNTSLKQPTANRGRVVSLDRREYLTVEYNSDPGTNFDDEVSTSSYHSSDNSDGSNSYFSEKLMSPKRSSRRNHAYSNARNTRLLPPGSRHGYHQQPNYSSSGINHTTLRYSKSVHESDASLSFSSGDDDDEQQAFPDISYEKPNNISRINSAPSSFLDQNLNLGGTPSLQPRLSTTSQILSMRGTGSARNSFSPPIPNLNRVLPQSRNNESGSDNNGKLNLHTRGNSAHSVSSIVSSSSEDKDARAWNADSSNLQDRGPTRVGLHRRTPSIGSTGSDYLVGRKNVKKKGDGSTGADQRRSPQAQNDGVSDLEGGDSNADLSYESDNSSFSGATSSDVEIQAIADRIDAEQIADVGEGDISSGRMMPINSVIGSEGRSSYNDSDDNKYQEYADLGISTFKSSPNRSPVYPSDEAPSDVLHPRPQPMRNSLSEDKMLDWTQGTERDSTSSALISQNEISPTRKLMRSRGSSNSKSENQSSSSQFSSHMTIPLVYSEDDTDESLKWTGTTPPNFITSNNNFKLSEAAQRAAALAAASTAIGTNLHVNDGQQHPQIISSRSQQNPTHNSDDAASTTNNEDTTIDPQLDGGQSSFHSSRPSLNNSSRDTDRERKKKESYEVYWQRWLMLFYMSLLNLLSDWTCYSVAPISLLLNEAFGSINPESLVTIFLSANAIATALEPIILSRLGLRKTVVFGAFLLMAGSVVKSGGIPGILGTTLTKGQGEWRVYAGFFLVGLSQPLYQCTPALLSGSWFPEKERTLATGVALNSNQLGIGCAFVFGCVLVSTSDDIPGYFGLLSLLSTLAFTGCFLQFDDAPPTPPSETARVMRGTVEIRIPLVGRVRDMLTTSFRDRGIISRTEPRANRRGSGSSRGSRGRSGSCSGESKEGRKNRQSSTDQFRGEEVSNRSRRKNRSSSDRKKSPSSIPNSISRSGSSSSRERTSRRSNREGRSGSGALQRRSRNSRSATSENGFRVRSDNRGLVPSPGSGMESTADALLEIESMEMEASIFGAIAPSPMMSGSVRQSGSSEREGYYESLERQPRQNRHQEQRYNPQFAYTGGMGQDVHHGQSANNGQFYKGQNYQQVEHSHRGDYDPYQSGTSFGNYRYPNAQSPGRGNQSHHPHQQMHMQNQYGDTPLSPWSPYGADPRLYFPSQPMSWQGMSPAEYQYYYQQQQAVAYYQQKAQLAQMNHFQSPRHSVILPPPENEVDEGAEPVVFQDGHNLDIDIRDDQIIRSLRACFARPGFIHAVVAFTVSGIVINTLSTYMDYLVRLGGSERLFVGIVGGLFQVLIMISSMIVGQVTDRTRQYYAVVIGLLVLGAFALAECGVSLDAASGYDLKWSLLVVAVLVGPLQPVATELGVDVVFPLSENTVLVIQQLFSNLLSALFIPFFQAVSNVGKEVEGDFERPQYTFSFYLLIVIHATATVFFATFNGKYVRLEHELENKEKDRLEEQGHSSDFNENREYFLRGNDFLSGNETYANQQPGYYDGYHQPMDHTDQEQHPLLARSSIV